MDAERSRHDAIRKAMLKAWVQQGTASFAGALAAGHTEEGLRQISEQIEALARATLDTLYSTLVESGPIVMLTMAKILFLRVKHELGSAGSCYREILCTEPRRELPPETIASVESCLKTLTDLHAVFGNGGRQLEQLLQSKLEQRNRLPK